MFLKDFHPTQPRLSSNSRRFELKYLSPDQDVKSSHLAKFLQASWCNRKWRLRGWKTSTRTRRFWGRTVGFSNSNIFSPDRKWRFRGWKDVHPTQAVWGRSNIFDPLDGRVAFARLKYLLPLNMKPPKDLFHPGSDRIVSEKKKKKKKNLPQKFFFILRPSSYGIDDGMRSKESTARPNADTPAPPSHF